jgi:hypothetical protein
LQVAELSAQLAHLTQEKSRLENRNNILEKVTASSCSQADRFMLHAISATDSPILLFIDARLVSFQVVKLKDEYITELESKTQKEEVPSGHRTLNDALW